MAFNLTGTGAGYDTTGEFGASLNAGSALSSAPIITSGTFAVSGWIKGTATSTAVAISQSSAFWIGYSSGSLVAKYGSGGSEVALTSASAAADGAWHHVELNVDGTGGRFYLDGVLVASSSTTAAAAGASYASKFCLRNFAPPYDYFPFAGEVDDVAVWSAVQHTSAFSPPSATSPSAPNLVALWNLDSNLNDSAAAAAATAITMTGPTSGAVGSPSSSFTVGANGTITGTVTVTPSDGGAGGTFSPTSVAISGSTTTATFTYTPASSGAKTISATNNGGLSNPASITYTASSSAATAVTLTGPSSGTVGAASSAFTVGANGAITGTVTVTPSDSGGGGSFSPASVSISSGTPTATFTYTPATAGTKAISVTNNGGLASPSGIAYSASVSTTKAPNDAGIVYSPYNWLVSGVSAKSINPGAYFRTLFTGSSCTLNFDMASASTPYSRVLIRVDGRTWQQANIASAVAVTMPSGQDNSKHLLEVIFDAGSETINRWNSPQNVAVVLTGITLASSSDTLSAPDTRPRKLLIYGDSITEGVRALALNGSADVDRNSAAVCWPLELGRLMNAEVGVVGFGRQGIITSANGNVPAMADAWNLLWAGQARSLAAAPDYCIWLQGHNDGASNTVSAGTTMLNSMLAAMPGTQFVLFKPFSGNQAANLQSIRSGCSEPGRVRYVDTAGYFNTADSSDALHPYGYASLVSIAPKMAAAISTAAATTARTVTLTLVGGASLSGLKWAWRDSFSGPIMSSGTAGTTNSSGLFSATVSTTLASGGTGWLEVNNSDGTVTQDPMNGYSGPAQVS